MTRFLANPILWAAFALLAVVNMIAVGVEWWNVLALIVFIAMVVATRRVTTAEG